MRSPDRTPEVVSAALSLLCSSAPLGFSQRRKSRNHKGTVQLFPTLHIKDPETNLALKLANWFSVFTSTSAATT